eukprot:COSAG01_NODE_3388_length_6153_cov_2.364057_4_plen_232_part_00
MLWLTIVLCNRQGTLRTRERCGLDEETAPQVNDAPVAEKPVGKFRQCLASKNGVSIVYRIDLKSATPGPLGNYPWRKVNKRLIKNRRSRKLHINGMQRKYDSSEDARPYDHQVAAQLQGLGELFLWKWWTQYNYCRRYFWTQAQQIGCIAELLNDHCRVLASLETKIILPRTDRLGKVLLLPIGTATANETSDIIVEKEIVRCLQIADGAGRDEVGGVANEKSRLRQVRYT